MTDSKDMTAMKAMIVEKITLLEERTAHLEMCIRFQAGVLDSTPLSVAYTIADITGLKLADHNGNVYYDPNEAAARHMGEGLLARHGDAIRSFDAGDESGLVDLTGMSAEDLLDHFKGMFGPAPAPAPLETELMDRLAYLKSLTDEESAELWTSVVDAINGADAMTTGEPMSSEAYDQRRDQLATKYGVALKSIEPGDKPSVP